MKFSLAITTFNRFEMTVESFAQVIDDRRIDDIIILDDASTDGSYEKLADYFEKYPQIGVVQQLKNRGMGQNKRDAIALAKNEWVIIFDSDNILTTAYIDAIPDKLWPDTIYQPSFAKHEFDFRQYANTVYKPLGISKMISYPMFNTMLNACNYLVHRDTYCKVFEHNPDQRGADTIWFAYLWLKAGHNFFVVPGMEYEHRVHPGSGFLQDIDHNMQKAEHVRKLIQQL